MSDGLQIKIEHLKLAQGVVTRMAGNSAQMKTWAVSLATATLIFSGISDDPSWWIAVGGWVAVIVFWRMDANYLHLEKCYVQLYNAIVEDEPITAFDLDYKPYVKSVDSIWKIVRSWSVILFYGPLLLVMSLLWIVTACGGGK